MLTRPAKYLFRLAIAFSMICVFGSHTPMLVTEHLGFNLMPHYPNNLNTFGIISLHQGKIIDFKSLPVREFVLIGSGLQKSPANPEQINWFEDYSIPLCDAYYDEPFGVHRVKCPTINNLWKLRYANPPDRFLFEQGVLDGEYVNGWAKGQFAPDDRQMEILKTYGIYDLDDFVYGEKCFELIKATTQSSWVSEYIGE